MTPKARKRLLIVIIILGAIVGSFFVARQVRRNQRVQLIASEKKTGLEYYQLGDYENALKHLRYYISANQDDGEMLLIFAECRLNVPLPNNKHIIEGRGLIRHAANLLPNNPEPLIRLIDLYEQLGYLTERLETCEKLLALNRNNLFAIEAKIETLAQLGNRNAEAISTVAHWINLEPANVDAHQWNMILQNLEGKPSAEIVRYAAEQRDKYPESLGFATLYAMALAQDQQFEEAKTAIQAAMLLSASEPEEIRELVDILDRLGLADKADDFLTRELEASSENRAEVSIVIVERAWKRGEIDSAKQFLPKLTTNLQEVNDDLLGWTVFLFQSETLRATEHKAFHELKKRQSSSDQYRARLWVRLLQGRDAIFQANWIEAREKLTEATRIKGGHPIASMLLGQVYRKLGENDLAIAWFHRAAASDPVWPTVHQLLGLVYLDTGRLDEARAAAESAFRAKPTTVQLAMVAEVYIQLLEAGQGDLRIQNDAISVLEELLRLGPDEPDLIATTARAYIVTERLPDALPLIQRLLDEKLQPRTAVLLDLIDSCTRNGLKLDRDLLALGGASESADSRVTLRLAIRSASQGRYAEGRLLLQKSLDTAIGESEKLECRMALASYLDQFNDAQALATFNQLAQDHPNSAVVQRLLLDSKVVWTNESMVEAAVTRLKNLTGADATGWKIYQARKLLTFLPTGENAPDPDSPRNPFEPNAAQAVSLLAQIAKANPGDARVQALLTEAFIILGDRDLAINALTQALDSNFTQTALYPRLIELLQEAGRTAEVQARLREFARRPIPKSNPELRRHRARLQEQNAAWADAIADIKPLAEEGRIDDLIMLARLYERVADTTNATLTYQQALAAPEVNATAIAAAADFYARNGNYEAGLELFDHLPGNVGDLQHNLMIAHYMERAGQTADAEEYLRAAARSNPSPDATAGLVRFLIRQERLAEAEEVVNQALTQTPDQEELAALAELLAALQGGDIDLDLFNQLGLVPLDAESQAASAALIDAEKYLRENPNDLPGYLSRIITVTENHPSFYAAWHLLVSEYLRQRQIDDAIQAAHTTVRRFPGSASAVKLATRALLAGRHYTLALSYAKQWRDLTLYDPFEADLAIAFTEWSLGRGSDALERAERWQERIIRAAGETPSNLILLATLKAQAGRTHEAYQDLQQTIENDDALITPAARIAEQIADYDAADQWLRKLLLISRDNIPGRSTIVGEYYKLAQRHHDPAAYQHVIDLAATAVENPEFQPAVIAMVADANQQVGNYDEAERLFRLVITREPNNAVIMNNLAFMLYTRKRFDADSEKLTTDAVNLAAQFRFRPEVQANFLETQGLILIGRQKYAEAITALRKGQTFDSRNPALCLALAEAYIKTDQKELAQAQLAKIDEILQRRQGTLSVAEKQRLHQVAQILDG